MRLALVACAATLAAATLHASQDQKKIDKPLVVVTGCVDGTWLKVRNAGPGAYAERYKLRGAKQLLKEMAKQYRGHLLEVTGAVTDRGDTVHQGKTIDVGRKTRIYTGAKEVPASPSGTGDPTLEVESFRDLKDTCK